MLEKQKKEKISLPFDESQESVKAIMVFGNVWASTACDEFSRMSIEFLGWDCYNLEFLI